MYNRKEDYKYAGYYPEKIEMKANSLGLTVVFTNTSMDGSWYGWDFGDGITTGERVSMAIVVRLPTTPGGVTNQVSLTSDATDPVSDDNSLVWSINVEAMTTFLPLVYGD